MNVALHDTNLTDDLLRNAAERQEFLTTPDKYLRARGINQDSIVRLAKIAQSKLVELYEEIGRGNPFSKEHESYMNDTNRPSSGVKDTSVAVGSAAVASLAAIVSAMTSLATAATSINR